MEADLSQFHNIDLRDRWRRLPDGSRALTLRMLNVRIRRLPPESAVATIARDNAVHWSNEALLLADIWQAVVPVKPGQQRKPHPRLRKDGAEAKRRVRTNPKREMRRRDAIRRQRQRRERFRREGAE